MMSPRRFRWGKWLCVWSGVLCALQWASPALAGRLSPEEARDYIACTPNVFVLDVRSYREFSARHIFGAHNIPVHHLEKRLDEIPIDRPVVINCAFGARARRAYHILQRKRKDIQELHYIEGWPYFPPPGKQKIYLSLGQRMNELLLRGNSGLLPPTP